MATSSHLSRRRFVSTLAAATAALALPPASSALSQGGDAPASSRPRLQQDWREAGVIATRNSPHARLKSIPVQAITIEPGFWSSRRETNVRASIPSMRQELLDHGRMDNFLRLTGGSSAPQRGPVYSDSDIYKWMEAVAFALQSGPEPQLQEQTAAMIRQVVAAQEPDGYLNTYFNGAHKADRMLPKTQIGGHETYCIGHLLQGGIAWYRATGDPTLLDAGIRFVDQFLIPGYGPGPAQTPIVAGHPEIEMALIELYRTTGEKRYLDLAGYILHGDTRFVPRPDQVRYMFCGVPFPSRTRLEGHAVRAMYACCGATDYYLETGDPAYLATLNTLWNDLSAHQLYVTGGVGARSEGEAFGDPYELPNATAYGESCAAIGNMMWNWRMLSATGDSKHADVMERALYNGINSGMSLDGKMYCYRNPLAFDPSTGDTIRNPWYDTTCCPPNLERILASLPGYFYSSSDAGLYVHLYDNSELRWHLSNGSPVIVRQTTRYPWEGAVRIAVAPHTPQQFTIFLRIPSWSKETSVLVNGKPVSVRPGTYLPLRRLWTAGDEVILDLDMRPQLIHANPAVADDRGRVALERGPVVYCMEQLDQPAEASNAKAFPRFVASLREETHAEFKPDMLGGIMVLEHPGALLPEPAPALYQDSAPAHTAAADLKLRLIPYYAWCNRERTAMQVWVPYQES